MLLVPNRYCAFLEVIPKKSHRPDVIIDNTPQMLAKRATDFDGSRKLNNTKHLNQNNIPSGKSVSDEGAVPDDQLSGAELRVRYY